MSVTVASEISCPLCKSSHPSIMSVNGLRVLACPTVATGLVGALLPKYEPPVIVIGAGEYVDSVPPKPKSDAELYADMRAAEAQAAAPQIAGIPSRAEMEKRLAAAKKVEAEKA